MTPQHETLERLTPSPIDPREEITEISEDMILELAPEDLLPLARPRRSPPPLPHARS
jgi:hypothetical protein